MPSPGEIVSQINTYLSSPRAQKKTELGQLATAYREACLKANIRLQQCADYLRRNLLTEAVYHAEVEPDLLNLVGALDLPRFDVWDEVCQEHELDRAPRLMLAIAQNLNEAYKAEAPRRSLLKKLTVLSLAQAPLRRKLQVLRSLAALDPNCEVWDLDIEGFERARLREITIEVQQAAKDGNLEELQRLLRETTEQQWRIGVSVKLVKHIRSVLRDEQIVQAVQELETMLPGLDYAYSDQNYEEASAILCQWDEVVSTNALAVPAHLQERIQPIAEWIATEDQTRETQRQFAAACAQLEGAIDGGTSMHGLHRLHRQATSFDRPIAEELQLRFSRKYEELRLQAKRKRTSIFLASGLVAIAAVVVAGVWVRHSINEGQRTAFLETFIAHIDAAGDDPQRLKAADAALDQVRKENPRWMVLPEFETATRRLKEMHEYESGREQQLAEAIEAMEVTLDAIRETDSKIEERAWDALTEAKALMKTEEEKTHVLELEGILNKQQSIFQAAVDSSLRGRLKPVAKGIDGLDPSQFVSDPDKWDKKLNELRSQLAELEETPDISDDARGNLKLYGKLLKQHRDAIKDVKSARQQAERQQRAKKDLWHHAYSAEMLAKKLEEYANRYPGSPEASNFKEAAKQKGAWLAVQDWDKRFRDWGNEAIPKNVDQARKYLKGLQNHLDKHPSSPLKKHLEGYRDYLAKAKRAMAGTGGGSHLKPLKEELQKLMGKTLMELYYIEVQVKKPGKRKRFYYEKGSYSKDDEEIKVDCCLNTDLSKGSVQQTFKPGEVLRHGKSPQLILAEQVNKWLKNVNDDEWNTIALDAAEKIRTAKRVDAILRGMLLKKVLEKLEPSAWGIEDDLTDRLKKVKGWGADRLNWINPNDPDANKKRSRIKKKLLNEITNFKKLKNRVMKKQKEMTSWPQFHIKGYGVLLRYDDQWRVDAEPDLKSKGNRVFAITNGPRASETAFRRIGTIQAEKFVADASSFMRQGSIVAIVAPPG